MLKSLLFGWSVQVPGEKPEDVRWYDVGVFKSLFCEVTQYYLSEEDQGAASNSQPSNTQEVSRRGNADV